jgi:hypothetical protein
MREAAFEGPALLSGLDEDTRNDLRRRLALNDFPEEAAYLDEEEEAIKVANAAIKRAVDVLQEAAGFAGNGSRFRRLDGRLKRGRRARDRGGKGKGGNANDCRCGVGRRSAAAVRQDIHRIFAEAFPTIFKTAA